MPGCKASIPAIRGFCQTIGWEIDDKPELLGEKYFEYHLATLDHQEAERFVDQTIKQLDAMIVSAET
jgi:hypothetical protein